MSNAVKQRGAALVVSLLILVILTILALATVNTSSVDMKISYNAQLQAEVEAGAQGQIENLLRNYRNFTTWDANSPCATCLPWDPSRDPASNPPWKTSTQPINGVSYTVTIFRPVCVGYADVGAEGDDCSATSQSISLNCNAAHWDVKVEVQSDTGAKAIFHQGVRIRIDPSGKPPLYDGTALDTNLRKYCSN